MNELIRVHRLNIVTFLLHIYWLFDFSITILNALQYVIWNLLLFLNQNNLAQYLVENWWQFSNCMSQSIQICVTEIKEAVYVNLIKYLCPKNLTFPKAERDQRCLGLVVVVFCLFFSICQSDLLFAGMNQPNSFIEIDKQKTKTTKRRHRWSRSAFGKVRFLGH